MVVSEFSGMSPEYSEKSKHRKYILSTHFSDSHELNKMVTPKIVVQKDIFKRKKVL